MLALRDYTDADASAFYAIGAAWIEQMFALEAHDEHVLRHPRTAILDPGGAILIAELDGAVVGTGALMPDGAGGVELTKMGVTAAAQGHGVGRALLDALIARAAAMCGDPLYLLTNRRCAAAIHLYERSGFVHDAEVMAMYGKLYERCDVAMRFSP